MKTLPLILAALALASCGEPIKPWSLSYREASTTRIYTDTSPAQAITAAETVLKLTSAPRDVSIEPTADGFVGDRYFTGTRGLQIISGDYRFTLSATAQGKNTQVKLRIDNRNPFDGPVSFTDSLDRGEVQVADPYTLYFARMDYLLGQRKDWVSCRGAGQQLGLHVALEPICVFAVDHAPAAK
ncbi:hypothetical protein FGG78_21645 [Thioclava sp. BHET1]|nr:hypothetical protein FGG78_21645 [Thioclava sp. BHET1]